MMKVLIVESEFLHQDTWVGNAVERLADALSQQNVTVIKSTSFDDGFAILSSNEAIDCLMFSYQMEHPDEHQNVRQLIGKLHERQQNVPVFLLGDREKALAAMDRDLGWFWFRGETYMAAWNVSGLGTFGAIQSTLNVTLWSFIGVESASVAAGVVKNPKRNVPIATIGGVLIAAVCYVLSTTAIMGMIPNAALRVSASPFGDAARMALGDTAGAIVSFCAAAGCLGSLGGWTLLAGQTAKAAADDGLFPPIFARVNKAGTPVAGLIIVGILMTIFQLSSISPNATKEFGLVSSVSVIFTLVPYLYTCAALLLLGHGHFGKARPAYLAVTTIAFLYCIWAVVGSGAKEVMWSFVTLMVITAMYALNYNRLHKNPYPLDAPISKD